MKIEFGCGDKLNPGFVGCDVRALPGVKYVCNAWEIADFVEPNSVERVHSRHFFEHLTFYDGSRTLKAWYNILKPDGMLSIIVPDMLFHINQWLNTNRANVSNTNGMTDEEWAMAGFWGWQNEAEEQEIWDVHKSGYDYPLLKKTLEKHGFKDVRRVDDLPKNLIVECFK